MSSAITRFWDDDPRSGARLKRRQRRNRFGGPTEIMNISLASLETPAINQLMIRQPARLISKQSSRCIFMQFVQLTGY